MAGAYRIEVIRTEKADEFWPFFTVSFVVFATDAEWAEKIAKEAIEIIGIHRGAFGAMRIDNVTEITVSGI